MNASRDQQRHASAQRRVRHHGLKFAREAALGFVRVRADASNCVSASSTKMRTLAKPSGRGQAFEDDVGLAKPLATDVLQRITTMSVRRDRLE
jgi:hypothetical protein